MKLQALERTDVTIATETTRAATMSSLEKMAASVGNHGDRRLREVDIDTGVRATVGDDAIQTTCPFSSS